MGNLGELWSQLKGCQHLRGAFSVHRQPPKGSFVKGKQEGRRDQIIPFLCANKVCAPSKCKGQCGGSVGAVEQAGEQQKTKLCKYTLPEGLGALLEIP